MFARDAALRLNGAEGVMIPDSTLVILIAPNVSEQMGGEGVKALQILREIRKLHSNVIQITHGRNRSEIARLRLDGIEFVNDSRLMVLLWKSRVLRWLIDPLFSKLAIRLAEAVSERHNSRVVILHQTEPNSPVSWRSLSGRHVNVFGPINGNIYYPKIFRSHESVAARLRRLLHFPLQTLNRITPGGIKRAAAILCAGGERTRKSLRAAGCPESILIASVDCGVFDDLLDRPRIEHAGANPRFVHFGRLVFHKGTFLILEGLSKARAEVCLDVIGRGPELEHCRQLAHALKLGERVRFLDWYPSHGDLLDALRQYRGVVLPSLEDANGIVIQEALALGLPSVCLDWGGPQLLIRNGLSGYLISPKSREYITDEIAARMDRLATDGALAESMSIAGRKAAQEWRWSAVAREWMQVYGRAAAPSTLAGPRVQRRM